VGNRRGGRERGGDSEEQVNNINSSGTATGGQTELWGERCIRVDEWTLLEYGLLAGNADGQPEEGVERDVSKRGGGGRGERSAALIGRLLTREGSITPSLFSYSF